MEKNTDKDNFDLCVLQQLCKREKTKIKKALECYKVAAEKNPESKDCSNKVKQLTKVLTQKAKKFRFDQKTEKK